MNQKCNDVVREDLTMLKDTFSSILIRLNATFVKDANNSIDAIQDIIGEINESMYRMYQKLNSL